jgi:hypothetical protein
VRKCSRVCFNLFQDGDAAGYLFPLCHQRLTLGIQLVKASVELLKADRFKLPGLDQRFKAVSHLNGSGLLQGGQFLIEVCRMLVYELLPA